MGECRPREIVLGSPRLQEGGHLHRPTLGAHPVPDVAQQGGLRSGKTQREGNEESSDEDGVLRDQTLKEGFDGDPRETFCRHIWISPFHEDDVPLLRDLIGADRMIMGSDFPHAEGLAEPREYVHELDGFSQQDVLKIMRDNAESLITARPV